MHTPIALLLLGSIVATAASATVSNPISLNSQLSTLNW